MFKLHIVVNGVEAASYDVRAGGDYVLGRDPSAQFVVPDRSVSRRHCKVSGTEEGVEFVDLKSANGLKYRGNVVERCVVKDGEEVLLGTTRVKVLSDSSHTGMLNITDLKPIETTHVKGEPRSESSRERRAEALTTLSSVGGAYRQLEHDRLAILVEAAKSLTASFDLDELLKRIIKHLFEIMSVHRAAIVLKDGDGGLTPRAVQPENEGDDLSRICSQHIIRSVMESRKGEIIEDAKTVSSLKQQHSVLISNIRAAICVPMISQDRVLGAIYADCPGLAKVYTNRDLEFLTAFAGLAAVAIENAGMHEELRERDRLRREFEIAAEIQRGLLPPEDTEHPGLLIDWAYIPARNQIGGDFYDIVSLDDAAVGILIGDVSGKSLPAALFMSRVLSFVRATTLTCKSAGESLTVVNRLLVSRMERPMFATAFYMVVDRATRTINFANAGHPPVQYLDPETGTFHDLPAMDWALAVSEDHSFRSASLGYKPGSLFVLYTDGILEARDARGEQFGIERIRQTVLAARHLTPKEISRCLLDAVKDFIRGSSYAIDDIALVILKLP